MNVITVLHICTTYPDSLLQNFCNVQYFIRRSWQY